MKTASAIKTSIVGEARKLIAEADSNRVGRSAPATLGNAKELVSQVESSLDADRYNTAEPRLVAAEAEYQARHASYLATQVTALDKNKISGEELILAWEKPLRDVAGALGSSTDMSAGYEQPGAEALARAQQVVAENEQQAAKTFETALEAARAINTPYGRAHALMNVANRLATTGQRRKTRDLLEEARRAAQQISDVDFRERTLRKLRDLEGKLL